MKVTEESWLGAKVAGSHIQEGNWQIMSLAYLGLFDSSSLCKAMGEKIWESGPAEVRTWDRVILDHLMLGMTSLTTSMSLAIADCTADKAAARLEGEEEWARTTRLEAGVHFTPTTRVCECQGRVISLLFRVVTRVANDGRLSASI